MDKNYMLLEADLKTLKLSSFIKHYQEASKTAAHRNDDYISYLQTLTEQEVNERQERRIERRIKNAAFPVIKTLESFDFSFMPSLNKQEVLTLTKCQWIEDKKNIIALGNSGMGKTHLAIALGVSACTKDYHVGYKSVATLAHELMEAQDEKQFLRYQKKLQQYDLLILDELGYVPLTKTGAELLFDVFSSRYEKGSILLTTNLPFAQWTEVFGCERLTGALLDRLTHHVILLEMNGESYRLRQRLSEPSKEK